MSSFDLEALHEYFRNNPHHLDSIVRNHDHSELVRGWHSHYFESKPEEPKPSLSSPVELLSVDYCIKLNKQVSNCAEYEDEKLIIRRGELQRVEIKCGFFLANYHVFSSYWKLAQ